MNFFLSNTFEHRDGIEWAKPYVLLRLSFIQMKCGDENYCCLKWQQMKPTLKNTARFVQWSAKNEMCKKLSVNLTFENYYNILVTLRRRKMASVFDRLWYTSFDKYKICNRKFKN